MLDFCETNGCRRKPLLSYFGEIYREPSCETCDNCETAVIEDITQENLVELTIPAQKFLSCVQRTGQYFGTSHIIDVLRGSRSQKVLSRKHDQLSTYDIGREFSKKEWQLLAQQFVQQQLLTKDMEHGSLRLTPKGYQVFKGEKVFGSPPRDPAVFTTHGADDVPYDRELFARLRAKRAELAAANNVPPYIIFSDRSLADMAIYCPLSLGAFAGMYGVGEAKLKKYASEFLPIIQAYSQQTGVQERRRPVSRHTSDEGDRTEQVADAYNAGSTVTDLALELGVKKQTVINHLWKTVQAGKPLRPGGFLELSHLPAEDQDRVFAAFAELGIDFLKPIYDKMDGSIGYDELHVLRLHFVSTQEQSASKR